MEPPSLATFRAGADGYVGDLSPKSADSVWGGRTATGKTVFDPTTRQWMAEMLPPEMEPTRILRGGIEDAGRDPLGSSSSLGAALVPVDVTYSAVMEAPPDEPHRTLVRDAGDTHSSIMAKQAALFRQRLAEEMKPRDAAVASHVASGDSIRSFAGERKVSAAALDRAVRTAMRATDTYCNATNVPNRQHPNHQPFAVSTGTASGRTAKYVLDGRKPKRHALKGGRDLVRATDGSSGESVPTLSQIDPTRISAAAPVVREGRFGVQEGNGATRTLKGPDALARDVVQAPRAALAVQMPGDVRRGRFKVEPAVRDIAPVPHAPFASNTVGREASIMRPDTLLRDVVQAPRAALAVQMPGDVRRGRFKVEPTVRDIAPVPHAPFASNTVGREASIMRPDTLLRDVVQAPRAALAVQMPHDVRRGRFEVEPTVRDIAPVPHAPFASNTVGREASIMRPDTLLRDVVQAPRAALAVQMPGDARRGQLVRDDSTFRSADHVPRAAIVTRPETGGQTLMVPPSEGMRAVPFASKRTPLVSDARIGERDASTTFQPSNDAMRAKLASNRSLDARLGKVMAETARSVLPAPSRTAGVADSMALHYPDSLPVSGRRDKRAGLASQFQQRAGKSAAPRALVRSTRSIRTEQLLSARAELLQGEDLSDFEEDT